MEKEVITTNENKTLEKSQVEKGPIRALIRNYGFIVPVVLAVVILFNTLLTIGNIPSPSMYPTLDIGSGIFAVKVNKDKIYRGEIIMFHPNKEEGSPKELWIKRIIGLPGDTIELDRDCVYVNGELLDEPYINTEHRICYDTAVFEVPEGHIFVMGDNRNDSFDSRYWENSYLPIEQLTSKPLFTFPISPHCDSGFKLLNNEAH